MKKKDILYGKNAIVEALKSGESIDTILINQAAKEMTEIIQLAKQFDVPVKKVPIQKIDYLLFPFFKHQDVAHQGVVATLNEFTYSKIDDIYNQKLAEGKSPVFVFLDRITDVGNFGAIARSSLCFDVDAIIIPNKNSVTVNAQANNTSAGALSYLPVCRVDNIWEMLDYFIQCGFQLVGASEKARQTMFEVDYTLPTVIVLGNENTGISLPVQKTLTHQIKIPMNTERFDSLNVSVSAGILLSHIYGVRNA